MLNIPYRTLKWRMRKNGLYRRNYSEISDEELVKMIKRILRDDPYLGNALIYENILSLTSILNKDAINVQDSKKFFQLWKEFMEYEYKEIDAARRMLKYLL